MAEICESSLLIEERNKYFPWVAEVNKRFSKCFPSDYDEETLDFFHREIEKELGAISVRSPKKNEALFSTLLCFYNHFCWKTKWKKPSRMKSSCARILSSICKIGLMLSKGNVQSKWINKVLSAVSIFPGGYDYLYGALLQVNKINKKYYSAYAAVLRHILKEPQPKTENPCTFFKLLLLFRRLKFFLQNPHEKARVDSQAASVAIPENLMSWLADNDMHDVSKVMKKNKMMIMKKKFANVLLVRIREVVLRDTSMETSPILKDNEAIQFSIDCNPETVNNELLSNFLNMEEDIVNSEADVEITKSKRKSTVEYNESNEGGSAKKRKKKALGNMLSEKRTAIEQSPNEVILESKISDKFMDSNLGSNTSSNSKKKQKKNSQTKFDQDPQKEISEISVDISLKEDFKAPISTDVAEIENDSMLIQSYSSAIQSINKGKKKRNTINIVEESNSKNIENGVSINEKDLAHVHSIKKGKKKRKTINIVEDIENSSNIDQNESLNVRSAKKDQKTITSVNVVQKRLDTENELVVNEKAVSSTKKGKKRKSLNIAQENVLSDKYSQSESEPDVSLYVQSLETGKNRRKTITITQDSSQKYIEKNLLNVSSSKKGKKKRQTINTVEEINRKNRDCQSKFKENYSLCTPPVTTESDSSIPRSASKTNNKRRKAHFTSADFIVTSCENVNSVDKDDFNDYNRRRNSTSTKNEWIITVNKSDSKAISLTPKTPPEKHNFKVSEIKETISKAVAVETSTDTKVEAIAERNNAKNISTLVDLTLDSESESLDTDEEAKSFKSDKRSIIKPIPKAVKFVEEIEYISSTNDTETSHTGDGNESISETESVGTAEEAQSSESTDGKETIKSNTIQFVDETDSVISSNEMEAANTEEEEADESISKTETAESSDETDAIMPINESVKFVDEAENIVSTNEAEAFESVAKISESNILEKAGIVETTESREELVEVTESIQNVNEKTFSDCGAFSKLVADIEKVKNNKSDDVGPRDKTGDFKSITEPIDEKNMEDEKSEDVVAEAVKIMQETKEIDSTIQTEAFESIPETVDKTVEDVEIDEDKGTVDIIEETEDISFDEAENLDSISEIEEGSFSKIQTGETVKEVKLVDIVKETEPIDFNVETNDFEPIPETEEETIKDVEVVEDTNAVNTIEETESIDSFNKSQDFDLVPELNEIIEETKDIVSTYKTDGFESIREKSEVAEAVKIMEETKEIDSTIQTEVFESIPETVDNTVEDVEIDKDKGTVDIIEETEDISFYETENLDSISETEERSFSKMQTGETVKKVKLVDIVKEAEPIDFNAETSDFEPVPETAEETIKDVEIVEDTKAVNTIEETENIDFFNKSQDFNHIPETNEIIEETKSIVSTNKTDVYESVPETEEENVKGKDVVDLEAIEIEETEDIDSTNKIKEFEHVPGTQEESKKMIEESEVFKKPDDFEPIPETEEEFIEDVEGSEVIMIVEETKDFDCTETVKEFEPIPETEEESVKAIENFECSEAVVIIEETNDIDSTYKIEEYKHVPETEEKSKKTVEDSKVVFKLDDFEHIPETENESVENVKGSKVIEIVEKTKDIDYNKTVKEFEPIPETQEKSEKAVENVEGSEAIEIIKEIKDIDFTNKTDGFESVPETETVIGKDIIVDLEAIEIIGKTDFTNEREEFPHIPEAEKESKENVTNCEGSEAIEIVEETTSVSIKEIKTVHVVKDENITESIDKIETVVSTSKPEAIDIIQETDVNSSDKMEVLELIKDANTSEFTERNGSYINTKTVKDVQETEVMPVKKAEVRDSIETIDKTETDDSDEILEVIDSTDRTETEDTDEYLEIIESTDDKTESDETDERLKNFDFTNKAKAENIAEPIQISNGTQCSTEISESELDTSITQYNSLVKEIFCDAGSDDSVLRESLSPYKTESIEKPSVESVSSQSVTSPKSSAEILENKPSVTKNCEISSLDSETDLNSSENIADESSEIEEAAAINNTQYYCKLLLKEVTEDNLIEDFDNETVDESKNIVDLELSKSIPIKSSSEETAFDSQAQFEGHSSTIIDISSSKIVVEAISNDEKVDSKEIETVESIAEGLYKKMLKAKKERLSLTDSVPEKTAAAILTENTVNYVIGQVIKKVEDVNNTSNGESIEDLKKQIKFAPGRSQLPKLGNLSNLKPFGFPDEKSDCLSFVDFSSDKVSDSTEIESSNSCSQAKRKDFYPYRNLLTIEVPDDKSESNFSDVLVDDKLEESIYVPNEEDSSDDDTEIDEVSHSPISNSTQNENILKEAMIDEEIQSSVLETQCSPKLDSEELRSLVCTMKTPVVNLGHKCDDVRFENELLQHDNDIASSYEKNEILSIETEKQMGAEDIVESQTFVSNSHESKNKESKPEQVSENEEVITTRKLRSRNMSLSEVTNKLNSEEKNQNSEKPSHTRSRRKPSNLETNSESTSTNLRRSARRLRNEFKELRLDSPKRCNPLNEDISQNTESDSNGKPTKSKKLTTRSMAAKRNYSAVSKTKSDCINPSIEVEDGDTTCPKETSKNSFTRKRATRSTATATKITEYFSVQTKAELTPVNETESEDQAEDSGESSTENLPIKKRFTRSNAFAIDKLKSEPSDAKEDVKDSNLGDEKSKNTVPKRSTRITTRGASRMKQSQNTPAKEESDVEDIDTQSNVSEESHKENVANEDESALKEVESSSKEYNLRRSTRNLIRPSRLKLSQDHF